MLKGALSPFFLPPGKCLTKIFLAAHFVPDGTGDLVQVIGEIRVWLRLLSGNGFLFTHQFSLAASLHVQLHFTAFPFGGVAIFFAAFTIIFYTTVSSTTQWTAQVGSASIAGCR